LRRRSRPFSVVVAALVVCLFAAVGFRVGQIVRPSTADAASTWHDAAASSYSHARADAYRQSWQKGNGEGKRAGAAAGAAAGTRAGVAAAHAQASIRAVAAEAIAAALTSSPRRVTRGVRTRACIVVAGGLCETLGPRVTGKPCPPGSVPYAEGGVVCIPRVLVLAAKATGAAGTDRLAAQP
jgi:hypothetical protein